MNETKIENRLSQGSSSGPSENLNELEKLLNIHLFTIDLNQASSEIDSLYERICKTTEIHQFGIVIPVGTEQNFIGKIQSLLYTSKKVRELKNKLSIVSGETFSYGVYPQINNPVAVYQLESPAEVYANKYVLPPIKKGLNGFLRRLIFSVIKFHPSTAGIILIPNKIT